MTAPIPTIAVDQVLGAVARLHGLLPEQLTAGGAIPPGRREQAFREAVWLCYRHVGGYTAPQLGRLLAQPRSVITARVRDVDRLLDSVHGHDTRIRIRALVDALERPAEVAA